MKTLPSQVSGGLYTSGGVNITVKSQTFKLIQLKEHSLVYLSKERLLERGDLLASQVNQMYKNWEELMVRLRSSR